MAFFSGQDARSGRNTALDNYNVNNQWDDLGLHRVENLPLSGDKKRGFGGGGGAFDRPSSRNTLPSAAPPAAKAEIQAKWGSLYDESQDFTRADGIGGGDLHRSGENYRPAVRRSNSLGPRNRSPQKPARNYGAFGPPGLPPPSGLNPFKNAFGGMPAPAPAIPAKPHRVWGGALIGAGDSQAFLSAMLPGKTLGAPSSGLAASRFAPPELKLAAQQPAPPVQPSPQPAVLPTPPAPLPGLVNGAFGVPGSCVPPVANPPVAPVPTVVKNTPLPTIPVLVVPKAATPVVPKANPLAPTRLIVNAGDLVSDFVEGVVQFTHPQLYKITGLEDVLRKFREVLLKPELMVVFKAEVDAKKAPVTPSPERHEEEVMPKVSGPPVLKAEKIDVITPVVPEIKVNSGGEEWKQKVREALKTGNLNTRTWGGETQTSLTPNSKAVEMKSPVYPTPPVASPSTFFTGSSEKPKVVPVLTPVPSIQKDSTGKGGESMAPESISPKTVDLPSKPTLPSKSDVAPKSDLPPKPQVTKPSITPNKPNLPPHLAKKLGNTPSSSTNQPTPEQTQVPKPTLPVSIKKEKPAAPFWGEVPKVPAPSVAATPPQQPKVVAPAPPPAPKQESIGWGSGEASKPIQPADQVKMQVSKDAASNLGVPTPTVQVKQAPTVQEKKKEPTEEERVVEMTRKLHGTTLQNITLNVENSPTPPAPRTQKESLTEKPKDVPAAKETTNNKKDGSNAQATVGPSTTAPARASKPLRHAPPPTSGPTAHQNAPHSKYNPTAKAAPPQVTHTMDPEVELRAKKAQLARTKPWSIKVTMDCSIMVPSCPPFMLNIACNQDPSSEVLLALRSRLDKSQYKRVIDQPQVKEYVSSVCKAFNKKMEKYWGDEMQV